MEVRQVENVLNVTQEEFGKMGRGQREMARFSDLFVRNVGTDLVNRQFYQVMRTMRVSVKYALS
jgi:hypothetical protein